MFLKMRLLIQNILFTLIALFSYSCVNKNQKDYAPQQTAPIITKQTSFAADIQPFVQRTCTNCHVNVNRLPDPSNYSVFRGFATTKFSASDAEPKIIVALGENNYVGRMPQKGPYYDENSPEVATIRKWIQDGTSE